MENMTIKCQNRLVSLVLVVNKGDCQDEREREREREIRKEEKKEQKEKKKTAGKQREWKLCRSCDSKQLQWLKQIISA